MAILWLAGKVIFSGSLYIICFTGITKFGAVAPAGRGLPLIAGCRRGCFLRRVEVTLCLEALAVLQLLISSFYLVRQTITPQKGSRLIRGDSLFYFEKANG
ncbi:MAG: DUF423 domain-containing protein [Hymenobacter sp.]